ncbi:hypothetical protein QP162_02520 [Sphingomonas aurantiaca]|uniref:HAD family hydrolase n=1 Tax=Sphingomonas aurantiaca TaxID=185949 RepID=UPI002FE00488
MVNRAPIKALAFDVFGTVVDWRSGIARDAAPVLARLDRSDIDPHVFADGWRKRYQPALEEVRSGRRPFVILDTLHREALEDLLRHHRIDPAAIDDATLDDLTHAWHRLDPWPDSVEGLARLKTRFPIVTLSNGNIALMLDMARRAGLPGTRSWVPRSAESTSRCPNPTSPPRACWRSIRPSSASSPRTIATSPRRARRACRPPMSIARTNMAVAPRPTPMPRRTGTFPSAA